MLTSGIDGLRLTAYVNACDHAEGTPLYRLIVEHARRQGLAGASVFEAEESFGAHRVIHDVASEFTSESIALVIEIIETPEQVDRLAEDLAPIVPGGLIVVRPAWIVRWADGITRHPISATADKGENQMEGLDVQARRVTIYFGSADRWMGGNLGTSLIETCRKLGMAGATLSRGLMGFGASSVVHKAHFLGLSEDLPEKVEVIESPEACDRLIQAIEPMLGGSLIVVEDVSVIRCGPRAGESAPAHGD